MNDSDAEKLARRGRHATSTLHAPRVRQAYQRLASAQWKVFHLVVYEEGDPAEAATEVAFAHAAFMDCVNSLGAAERERICRAIDIIDEASGPSGVQGLSESEKLASLGRLWEREPR